MLQYDIGGPVEYKGRERELQVRAGLSRSRLIAAIDHLVALGKLEVDENGRLTNARSTSELKKIAEKIQKNCENSRVGGESTRRKWDKIRNDFNEETEPIGMPVGLVTASPIPSPSPSPSPKEKKLHKEKAIGTRLPPDWRPTDEGWNFAVKELGSVARAEKALAEFRDYWIAVPGPKGRKMDWEATWRNRIRQIATAPKKPQQDWFLTA